VAHALAGTGVDVFIHHSSVSRADRTLAEEQFAKGQNTAIVCTSTMELGIVSPTATGLPRLPVPPFQRAVPITPVDQDGCVCRLLPPLAWAFPEQ
jgi:hypothetical protein